MKQSESRRYIWLRDQLAESINSGVLKLNDSLPSERVLSEQFNVSRTTARQALIQLEKEGLARTVGRRNRFVSEPVVNYDLSKTISFFANSVSEKSELNITVINFQTITASDEQCKGLKLPASSDIHFYSRLCRVGSRPVFIEEECVSAALFPGLLTHDIAQPLSTLFERVYGIKSVRDQVTISQSQFSTEVSGFLELEDPAIGILLEQTVFDESDHPISFGCQYWCGDVARFSVDIRY
jgi:GntR family transcriptional regulator